MKEPAPAASSPRFPASRPAPWGFVAVLVALGALAAVVGWQTWAGLDHIDRMMADRSRTLYRMVATEVRNVARYGAARLERLDEVLAEVAAGGDVEAVVLARDDGAVRIAHGELPEPLPDYPSDGRSYLLDEPSLLIAGPVRIDTQGCGTCATCSSAADACPAGGGAGGIAGDYEVLLVLDAAPYLTLRRTVWMQAGAGALLVAVLALGLGLYQRQTREAARMRAALAVADERSRSLERLGRVTAGLAHEIKNPIGSLRGFAQLIAEHAAPGSKEAEYAGVMVGELDAITRRIDRLRDFARPSPPALRPARPVEVVRRVAALLEPDLAARSLKLELDLPDPGPEALLDAERFRDVVVNLLINAIEASPAGRRIRVRLVHAPEDDGLLLEVADEGPGIAPEERERVLRPFYSTKPEGLGLGLAVAQQGIEDHGGRLEIDAAPGGGALLRARWPRRANVG
jgi:signal transduction histidine kinase